MPDDNNVYRDGLEPLLRSSLFFQPERLAMSAWIEHVPFAFWIVDVLKPRTIVELGTHNGVSYSAMCQAVGALGLDTKCYAVDTWQGDEHAGHYSESVFSEFAAYHDRKFGAFSSMIRSTFDQALEHFTDGSIDLLHIDGLHTYEAVRHDFESWFPKLSANAVVMFHDTNVRERNFGVFRLWDEIKDKYRSFEFLHCHGLGVVGVGKNYPPALEFLFQSKEANNLAAIRNIFTSLGRSSRALNELLGVNGRVQQLEASVADLRKAVAERDQTISSMKRSVGWRLTKPFRSIQKRLH